MKKDADKSQHLKPSENTSWRYCCTKAAETKQVHYKLWT